MRSDYEAARDERFPDYREVLRESRKPVPAPPLVYRGRTPITVERLANDATARLEHERAWAEYRANRKRYEQQREAS